jgi:sirohydrochlorin cobaltochelatase
MMSRGLLLIAHGSKDPRWKLPFQNIAENAARQFPGVVVLAYLESAEPTASEALQQMLRAGVQHITVAPLFLAAGHHIRVDIPELIDAARQAYPHLTWTVLPAIGELDAVQQHLAAATVAQALHQVPAGADGTVLTAAPASTAR